MILLKKTTWSDTVRKTFVLCILLGLLLVFIGWILIPATGFPGIIATCLMLVVYGVVGYFVFPRLPRDMFSVATLFGLLASIIFAGEILLEYALLPTDNTSWGLIEFGTVFALYFLSAVWVAYRSKSIKHGILAAIVTAMLSALVWLLFVLLTFYLFQGTIRQELVLTAEGTLEDFARSGMSDFNTFVMEDLLGGGFFHLLLSPLIAAILGMIGSVVGKGIVQLQKH